MRVAERVLGLRSAPPRLRVLLLVLLLVVTTTVGLVTAVGAPDPAGADPIGSCTSTSGVIVAVDFALWGGNVERGCDATLTNGYDALQAAGFTTAGDEHDGPEFICRIDEDPPPSEDPCINTPPATAYWSYWHADAGQDTWSYSTLGAASYQPQPGSVDAWTFGSTELGGTDGQPPFPPSAVRATNVAVTSTTTAAASNPDAAPSTRTPKRTRARVGKVGAAARSQLPDTGPSTSQPVPTTTPPATSTAPPSTTTSSAVPATSVLPNSSTPRVVDASPASLDRQSSGSPVALIIGGLLVAALAAVAAVVARRRHRAS